jgi:hypothetical protein
LRAPIKRPETRCKNAIIEKGAAEKQRLFLRSAQIRNTTIASDQGLLSDPIFQVNEHPGSRQVGQASAAGALGQTARRRPGPVTISRSNQIGRWYSHRRMRFQAPMQVPIMFGFNSIRLCEKRRQQFFALALWPRRLTFSQPHVRHFCLGATDRGVYLLVVEIMPTSPSICIGSRSHFS